MTTMDQESYLSKRVDDQLSWLSKTSKASKRGFMRLRIFEILLGTAITVFSPYAGQFGWGPLAIAMAGGGIALSGSLLALNRNQENWVRYRSLNEALKREKFLFLTRATPAYQNDQQAFASFVIAVESLMSEERSGWARLISQQSDLPGAASPKTATAAPEPSPAEQAGTKAEAEAPAPDMAEAPSAAAPPEDLSVAPPAATPPPSR
jgi:hypothetical protein